MSQGVFYILKKYLKSNNISFSEDKLYYELNSNPDFPSLKSVSDSLDSLSISNVVVKLNYDKLDELPNIFIAQLNSTYKEELVYVKRLKTNNFEIAFESGKKDIISKKVFSEIWNEIVILVDFVDSEVLDEIEENKGSIIFSLSILSVLMSVWFFHGTYASLYVLLGLVNLFIGFISSDNSKINQKFIKKVCTFISNKSDDESCQEVINNAKSKSHSITFSDLSIVFFSSTSFFVILFGLSYEIIFYLHLLGIPIVLFSIYTQFFTLKKVCAICLITIVLFVFQLIILVLTNFSLLFNIKTIFYFTIIFLTTIGLWLYIKSKLLVLKKYFTENIELSKFYKNIEIFNKLLLLNKIKNYDVNHQLGLNYGDINSDFKIDLFLSPYCPYCIEAFNMSKIFIEKYKNVVQFNFIIITPVEKTEHNSTLIGAKIIELYKINKIEALNALTEWFENQNTESFFTHYGKPLLYTHSITDLKNNSAYISQINIEGTPSLVINGCLFPHEYSFEDLDYFINETLQNKNTNSY